MGFLINAICMIVVIVTQAVRLIEAAATKRVSREVSTYILEKVLVIFLSIEVILYSGLVTWLETSL